jgi:glycine/D-amino acid oxidase-like deaminating enzyme
MQDLAQCLEQTGRFHLWPEALPYSSIDPQKQTIQWQGQALQYDALIFAEGAALEQNPWWNFVPLQPLKGQILRVHIPGLQLERALTAPLYVVPQGSDEFLVGATYEHTFTHLEPTPEGRAELLTRLATVLPNVKPEIIDHQAGVRPTGPRGRRPCLGPHPQWKGMWFFNALGTKGVLIAPHFSLQLARRMWEPGYEPHPEVRLDRLLPKA